LYIAAAVGGLSKEIEKLIPKLRGWQSWRYMSQIYAHEQMPLVLFGLDDPAKVEHYARQLGCDFWTRDHVIGWLAHTETRALDWIVASINSAPTKTIAETLFGTLKLVDDEAISSHMLELEKSPIGMLASKWLNEHPDWAARGAARAVFTGSQIAEAYLKRLRSQGDLAQLQAAQMVLPSELQAEFQRRFIEVESDGPSPLAEENTPAWLKEALVLPPKKKAPDWVSMAELPPLLVDGHPLNAEQGRQLLTAFSLSTLEEPHPVVNALRAHFPSSMLDTFAWKLFEVWLSRGAPIKEKWGLSTVGLLGNDTSAMNLPPLICQWPTVTLYKRIELGLACLGTIGSDIALMQINRIAQKAEQGGLKYRAREAMRNIAASRNLSEDQLKDRIIPDCGLDADGQRTFDYGSRRFTFVLSPDLKPFVRDAAGKVKSDLPKPGVRDNAALAQEAFDTWKLLKKQIRDVVKLETERLHSALIDRRRWSLDEFEMFFVRHPLMTHLVQRLLWGVYDQFGKLSLAFRVSSERDYADIGDSVITLDQPSNIGLVHPIDMTAEDVETWKQIFNEYEIISPFPQLVRPVYTLLPHEVDAVEITRGARIEIETLVLAGVFSRLHWNADNPISHGYTVTFFKRFPAQNVIAMIWLDPGYMDFDPRSADNQHIKACYFISAEAAKDSYEYYKLTEKVRLGDIDPLAISEVLSDLAAIDSRKIITT
jgi:hypothetical protein